MPENSDERIKIWRQRWEANPAWVKDVIAALRQEPHENAPDRILHLSWYSEKNGFHPLAFSPDHPPLILDLRGILMRGADLKNIAVPFALLEGADLFRANLQGADLSFARLNHAILHEVHLEGAKLVAARFDEADLSLAHLAGADLTRACLKGADLGWAYLQEAKLISACLDSAVLEKANAEKANLYESSLVNANLSLAQCPKANFNRARLQNARLVASHLEDALFAGADLESADLSLAYLEGADLTSASLKGADLTRVHLERADLSEAGLMEANLFAANLEGAALRKADLRKANLKSATLKKANLRDSNFIEANLAEASLLEANLEGADLRSANLTGSRFRSQRRSALVNVDTRFGYKREAGSSKVERKTKTGWLFRPSNRLDKREQKDFDPAAARSLCNQVRMLYRDNGLFQQAAVYFEEENYWLTRIYLKSGKWWHYLARRIFFELFIGYGERPCRLVLTGVGIILLCALLFLFGGIIVGERTINYNLISSFSSPQAFITDLWICVLFSIQCFTTMGLGALQPAGGFSHTLASLEGLFGVFIIALGIVTFVRKAVRD